MRDVSASLRASRSLAERAPNLTPPVERASSAATTTATCDSTDNAFLDDGSYNRACCGQPRTDCDHCHCGRQACCDSAAKQPAAATPPELPKPAAGSPVGIEPKPDVDPSRDWPLPTKSSKRLVDGSPNWIPVPNAEGPGAMLSMPIQLHGLCYNCVAPLTADSSRLGPGRPGRPRVAQADPADRPLPAWPPPLPHDPHRAELSLPAVADQDLLLPLPPRPARGAPRRPLHRSTLQVLLAPWQRPGAAPAPPQGAPGGSGRPSTPRERPAPRAPSHGLGCSSPPPPKPPIPPPSGPHRQGEGFHLRRPRGPRLPGVPRQVRRHQQGLAS